MTTREQQRHSPRNLVTFKTDDDSDTDEPNLETRESDGRERQIIHSGHFMVSSLHIEHTPKKGYDFDTVNKKTCQTYHFGKASTSHLSIDKSLTKLFECMTLAYSGTLVSPKWKNFKGLKLQWRDKIRLNNAIWRAWFMQYVEKRENPVCHFVTPLDGSISTEDQRRPEAIFTEGKYCKRGVEMVREYHKWRSYFKKRSQKHRDDDLSGLLKVAGDQWQLSLFGDVCPDTLSSEDMGIWSSSIQRPESPIPMEMDSIFDIEMLLSENSDTLFSSLASHQPIAWPNPREIAHTGNADMIQPGLINLQPNLCDPLPGLFYNLRQTPPSSLSLPASAPPQTPDPVLPPVSVSLKTPPPITANQGAEMPVTAAHREGYLPLFSGPQDPVPGAVSTLPGVPPPPNTLPHPLPTQSSMATWKPLPSPNVSSSAATPTAPQTPIFALPRMPHKPAAWAQPPAGGATTLQPLKSSQSATRGRRMRTMPKIIPANPLLAPPLFLPGPFPKQGSTVIITPGPLQAEATPLSSIVSAPVDVTQSCRPSYISAEQKRRFSINAGFGTLSNLVPTLKIKQCSKQVSHAATLQKTLEYIHKLQHERQQTQDEARRLREEIEELNRSISFCHEKLPATGVPVPKDRSEYMWDNFNKYVTKRTLQNWKFWIFSVIIRPLFESFSSTVSTGSLEELQQTTLQWLERHCALPALRPAVLNALRRLSTTTSILTDPSALPEEALAQIHTQTDKP
ncbi:hypothetical protein AGOR_G00245340 [Albula goreensis]|uniref:BHLH domain-containing protein n=1 Tax=Albula goreensis TaxID=1534307 RepID=A0A8T3CAK0_9TELE|nr:hypothetical protein AGOR_G00245340 [Albula goreensis]